MTPRFDRNADQLSQIIWFYTQIQKRWGYAPDRRVNLMVDALQEALVLNDKLADAYEKGLI